ncbi:MAG TPA: FHA domain-containing protein [Vicinamibacterales bacterium]
MDVLRRARRLESRIAATLDEAAKAFSRSRARSPLEVVHAILDAVEQQIEPTGRGTRVFPFNRLELSVVASSPEARGRLEALLAGDTPLRTRVLDRLQSAKCSPADVVVEIDYVDHAEASWRAPEFDLRFARVAEPGVDDQALEPQPGQIEIRVLRGSMERWSYSFAAPRIDVGRGAEVRDHRNRLIRTNHVVFTEGAEDVNQTVSRTHGHIAYEPLSGAFRLHDDGSEHGTEIVRGGRTISVLPGMRGVRLQSDDEVVLGEARVRVRLRTLQ